MCLDTARVRRAKQEPKRTADSDAAQPATSPEMNSRNEFAARILVRLVFSSRLSASRDSIKCIRRIKCTVSAL